MQFLELDPGDKLALMYLDRAIGYENTPPPDDWNAADVFTKK
jgi:hypothetical protein